MSALTVTVPGTSANLGPGFDCLGMALDLRNRFTFTPARSAESQSLAALAYASTCRRTGVHPEPMAVESVDEVPRSRGLGSSATAVVAGVLAAVTRYDLRCSDAELLAHATAVEGHPDNVAPALFGGLVVAVGGPQPRFCRVPVPDPPSLLALIPDRPLSTREARRVLPRTVDRDDAAFNVALAALLVAALTTGQPLDGGFDDRLHQPYRGPLIPGFDAILAAARDSGATGCYLSGAGPTIMVVGPTAHTVPAVRAVTRTLPWDWGSRTVSFSAAGASVAASESR